MSLFTISPVHAFLDALVEGVMQRYGHDPLLLASTTIYLPTKRSCRTLQEAFLRYTNGKPLLLPAIIPMGEIEMGELLVQGMAEPLPPAIPKLEQRILLTRLIQKMPRHQKDDVAGIAQLALELERFLKAIYTENIAPDTLEILAPEELAHHWQEILSFLHVVLKEWPNLLISMQRMDPAVRHAKLIEQQILFWKHYPPSGPIIAAGSTGRIPATAKLLHAISELNEGAVIFPGLDKWMDAKSWDMLDPCHPQYNLQQLLKQWGKKREEVRHWHNELDDYTAMAREKLISELMCTAESSNRWHALAAIPEDALKGIEVLTSPTLYEEALAISCRLREILEHPGKTAALVTSERRLAKYVTSLLKRFGVECNDSAGEPISMTPSFVFLRLTAAMAETGLSPVALLAALKHPFAANGMSPPQFRHFVREMEKAVLRGVRLSDSFASLYELLATTHPHLVELLQIIEQSSKNFFTLMEQERADFHALLSAHIAFAESLATSDEEKGDIRLWKGDEGEQVALFFEELLFVAERLGSIPPSSYLSLLETLSVGYTYRPRYGSHPRIAILSPQEARLLHFDLLILGGLNEGSWPELPRADPWISRAMHQSLGLPLPERQIGQEAHHFASLLHAPYVILSRAEKSDGTPTMPSRWLLRIETLLGAYKEKLTASSCWHRWMELLYTPDHSISLPPPCPTPPVSCRPRRLPVTGIEKWMRDPYSLYAARILQLKPLEPLDAEPGAAEFGTFLHAALESFMRHYDKTASEEMQVHSFMKHYEEALGTMRLRPAIQAFWLPRVERIAKWFVHWEKERQQEQSITSLLEVQEQYTFDEGLEAPFTITAKADRIDLVQGRYRIILDYKTGALPTESAIADGFSPQMPLEALIFEPQSSTPIGELLYVRLSGGEPAGEVKSIRGDLKHIAAEAKAGLLKLIQLFDQPTTPYLCKPWPELPSYDDYAHLAREKEWEKSA